ENTRPLRSSRSYGPGSHAGDEQLGGLAAHSGTAASQQLRVVGPYGVAAASSAGPDTPDGTAASGARSSRRNRSAGGTATGRSTAPGGGSFVPLEESSYGAAKNPGQSQRQCGGPCGAAGGAGAPG